METTQTTSVITPYSQEEQYETGRILGHIDHKSGWYFPPPNSSAAMLAGYETGWSLQDQIERESQPDSEHESQWEEDLYYRENYA